MRTVGDACGVKGHHAPGDIFTAHKIAIHIIQQLITVDIAVVIRCGDRLRMIVEQPGAKRTDNIIVSFKGLVHRRWLVHAPGDGFEVVDTESKRVTTAIPPYHIKRMMPVMDPIDPRLLFCFDQEIARLVERLQVLRSTDITLAKGSMLE